MPGNVPPVNGTGLAVMPLSLSRAFEQTRELAVISNEYADGSSQRKCIITNGGQDDILPRFRWRLTKRLTAAKLTALRDFYDARKGGTEPFYFYDPHECVGFGNHDETGASEDGRFVVRFAGEWRQSMGIGRGDVTVELIELALTEGGEYLDFEIEENSGHLVTAGV